LNCSRVINVTEMRQQRVPNPRFRVTECPQTKKNSPSLSECVWHNRARPCDARVLLKSREQKATKVTGSLTSGRYAVDRPRVELLFVIHFTGHIIRCSFIVAKGRKNMANLRVRLKRIETRSSAIAVTADRTACKSTIG